MLRVRPEGDGERLREQPEHADATHQVAVLEYTHVVCGDIIGVQAASDAASNHCAMHGANDRKWQGA